MLHESWIIPVILSDHVLDLSEFVADNVSISCETCIVIAYCVCKGKLVRFLESLRCSEHRCF